MMHELLVLSYEADRNIAKALKKAEEDGYITTKTISDILKPVDVSEDFIISELTWWTYAELIEKIYSIGKPFAKPGYVIVKLPKYHTGRLDELPSKEETSFDAVSHPSHYTEGRKYEPRKVIADWGLNFNLGNAVKYISRAGRKGDKIEDLRKAIQYIEFEIEECSRHSEYEELLNYFKNRPPEEQIKIIKQLKLELNKKYGIGGLKDE